MAAEEKDKKIIQEEANVTAEAENETETIVEEDFLDKESAEATQEEATETASETAEADDKGTKESKSESKFFKKKKDKKDEQIEELNDKVKRQMAEFENFRRRSEKEKSQMYEMGAKGIVEKILPVVDNFERGLAAAGPEGDDSFVDGMNKIYKQLMTSLEEVGVTPIQAVGQEFDPNFHNAVMHVEDEGFGENEVVEELQKGYMYRETVVRHSMVKVAN